MRWFRSNIRLGARLAMIALAAQMVLTFDDVGIGCGNDDLAQAAQSSVAGQSGASPNSHNPADKSDRSGDSGCPICALIQLASTSAPSVAPVLPLPASFIVVRPEAPDELQRTPSFYFSFQARGPPSI
jgi:hypothetical protein